MKPGTRTFWWMLAVSVVLHGAALAFFSAPAPEAREELAVLVAMAVREEPAVTEIEQQPIESTTSAEEAVPEVSPEPRTPAPPAADDPSPAEDALPELPDIPPPAVVSSPATAAAPAYDPEVSHTYEQLIAAHLARHKRYPSVALRRRLQGDCVLRIELYSDGRVRQTTIVTGTGHGVLDREVRAMVDRASPFPAAPPELQGSVSTYDIPITFHLNS